MKAEFSDAPERIIRGGRRRDVRKLFAYLGMVSVIVSSSIFLLASRSGPERHSVVMEPGDRAPIGDAGGGSIIRAGATPSDPGVNIPIRQASFNDQNFVPTGARNVVSLHQRIGDVPLAEAPQKMKLTIVRQSPSMKDQACWPYRQGSVEARNCRLSVGLKHRD